MSETALQAIRNYRRISPHLATAGQPDVNQYPLLAGHFDSVINLARPDSPHALADEPALAARHGLEYIALPVDFKNPRSDDFEAFRRHLREREQQRVFVHCAMNWRVSSFIFLYRVIDAGVDRATALHDLEAVWQPDPVWREFIDTTLKQA
ncbi:protein tyrosine phosphatase (PTP) superfamily phosphohydrolase (DUF442 family) [Methylohalomonas lacus]|uniref:Protein tyrosine phosphatase (PTP) superfamily phosphohydrolase (DUF442 family) n=1 Tax=Methylohalomonas lacus TaxID=398773 RepID=A0AAE3HJN9_9GAMM|nr:protein tyrosine phosphatase family protein [Methylohalomonas lacus]MCS3903525.1 protein tyrosine phosphatase (PTP) superfamily phosphohydrolase (DUF442 family) [Methylohalomonas lacus]